MKVVLSVLLIVAGATLSNYSSISADTKNLIAEFCTVAGVIALIITIFRAIKAK